MYCKNVEKTTSGSSFDLYIEKEKYGRFSIPSYGDHNILNAMAVITFCWLEGIEKEKVQAQLETFGGVKRRFTEKDVADMIIIDDFAHHPSEIKATIDAATQKFPNKEIIAVFQPHTFTRTIALMDDFAKALDLADTIYLCDIFSSAREKEGNVSVGDLAKKIKKGAEILQIEDMTPLLKHSDSVVIFMGAGDVEKFENAYEELLIHRLDA